MNLLRTKGLNALNEHKNDDLSILIDKLQIYVSKIKMRDRLSNIFEKALDNIRASWAESAPQETLYQQEELERLLQNLPDPVNVKQWLESGEDIRT